MTRLRQPRSALPLTTTAIGLTMLLTTLAMPAVGDDTKTEIKPSAVGESFQVPYRLTDTNHYLVRVRINGKGPFNFLVDSGAPALYVGTEAAKKIDLEPAKDSYWTSIDRLDLEGGAILTDVKARVEDPFQLVGMNALGLPGASIDGILGFTILARFKMEFDPTRDRMTWTRIDYEPKEPFVPPDLARGGKAPQAPPDVQVMQALGPIMKASALLLGKQPEEKLHPQGFLGLELEAVDKGLRIKKVLDDSPAAKAGVKAGDIVVKLAGKEVKDLAAAHAAIAETRPSTNVEILVIRLDGSIELTITAGEGL